MTWISVLLAALLLTALPAAGWAAPQGKVVVAQGVDPTTLDPMNHQETPAGNVCRNIFDTLLERDQDLKIQPALARELPKLIAPTVWEFKLRPGVKFHNGEPVDAEAVKFSLERLVDPKNKMRGSPPFAPLSHVEIVDPLTVRIHTKAPWPILDTLMSTNQASILPPKYYRDKEVAEAIAGQLTKAGIRTTVRTHEWVHYFGTLAYNHRTPPVWLIGWGTSTYDAETVYVPLFRSGRFLSNYYNADFEGMSEQAQATMDPKKRFDLYSKINRLWVEDAAAMPLYQQLDLYGATKRMAWKARGDESIKGYDMGLKDTNKDTK